MVRNSGARLAWLPDDAHFRVQLHAVHVLDRLPARARSAPRDPRRVACAVIDDEIGVLGRDRGAADAEALQAGRLDQPRGMVAGRVGEHRAAAPLPDRLARLAPLQQHAHLARVGRPDGARRSVPRR